jgi:hypothetical protein
MSSAKEVKAASMSPFSISCRLGVPDCSSTFWLKPMMRRTAPDVLETVVGAC